jgi:hypothetical protein
MLAGENLLQLNEVLGTDKNIIESFAVTAESVHGQQCLSRLREVKDMMGEVAIYLTGEEGTFTRGAYANLIRIIEAFEGARENLTLLQKQRLGLNGGKPPILPGY